jgi:hypothetical protein
MPSVGSRIFLDLIAFFGLAAAVALAAAMVLVATVVLLAGRAEAAQFSPVPNSLQLQGTGGGREGWRLV